MKRIIVLVSTLLIASSSLSTKGEDREEIVLNPESLRTLLLDGNITILMGALQVHKAKEQVNLARARLLPSLNLGVAAAAIVNPSFMLSSVEYLLPFLLPSRWFEKAKAKNLLEAEKLGFLLTQMNEYASLYALYFTVLHDLKMRELLLEDLSDSKKLFQITEFSYEQGLASEDVYISAQNQLLQARARVTTMNELIIDEMASIRQVFQVSLNKNFVLEKADLEASSLEGLSIEEAVEAAWEEAPEVSQIQFLIKSAKNEKWKSIFSFFAGASTSSVSQGAGSGASFAFSDMGARGSFQFGFDYFPRVRLSQNEIDVLLIREKEIHGEVTRIVETTLNKLEQTKERHALTMASMDRMKRLHLIAQRKYELGEGPFNNVLQAQINLRQAQRDLVRTEMGLNQLRISLHRLMKTNQFSQIKGCEAYIPTDSEDKDWRWPWERDGEEASGCSRAGVLERLGLNEDDD